MGMKRHAVVDKHSSESTAISVLVLGSFHIITNLKSVFLLLQVQLMGFPARQTSCVDMCAMPLLGLFWPLFPGVISFITSAQCCMELGKHFQLFFMWK